MKNTVLLFILFFSLSSAMAQVNGGKSVLYYNELSFGAALQTQGWEIFSDYDKIKDARTKILYEFELGQIKSPKEYKQTPDFGYSLQGINSPKSYVYGKQNNFYVLDASFGREKEIGRKADKSGVTISIKYLGGISLGMLKPYYLELLYPIDNTTDALVPSRYDAGTAQKFLDKNSIYGGAGFSYGLGETQFIPGAHLKLGLNFDWASYDEFVKAIEVGATLDAYYKQIPIMILDKNQQFFPSLYVSVQFGERW